MLPVFMPPKATSSEHLLVVSFRVEEGGLPSPDKNMYIFCRSNDGTLMRTETFYYEKDCDLDDSVTSKSQKRKERPELVGAMRGDNED